MPKGVYDRSLSRAPVRKARKLKPSQVFKHGYAEETSELLNVCENCERELAWRSWYWLQEAEDISAIRTFGHRKKLMAFCQCGNVYYRK